MGNNLIKKISVGSRVVVDINNCEKQIELVNHGESDPGNGKISFYSPLGRE